MNGWHGGLCAVVLWPASALAGPVDYGSIDGFVAPLASIEAAWPETLRRVDDSGFGFGFGARVLSRVTDTLVVTAEFDHGGYDALDTNLYRLGAGFAGPSTSGVFLTYDHRSLDVDTAKGFALHGRVAGTVLEPAGMIERVGLYGDLAYGGWDADNFYFDGFEFTLGTTLDLAKPWGLFADYRRLMLDDRDYSTHDQLRLQEFRLGVRFRFDC